MMSHLKKHYCLLSEKTLGDTDSPDTVYSYFFLCLTVSSILSAKAISVPRASVCMVEFMSFSVNCGLDSLTHSLTKTHTQVIKKEAIFGTGLELQW